MSFQSISLACLLSMAGCGPKAPEIVHVGKTDFRFPRDPFYRSITHEGASEPSFVAYVTPDTDRRRSISLEYDRRENIKDRADAERQGLPYIFRGSFHSNDAFIVRRPWGTSICLREAIKVKLLGNCAANVTYRGTRWVVYFQHEMLDDPENIIERGLSILRAYSNGA